MRPTPSTNLTKLLFFPIPTPPSCSCIKHLTGAAADGEPKPPTLNKCVALLRQCKSLPHLKQIHAYAIRTRVPLSHAHFNKHLIFILVSLLPLHPTISYALSAFSQTASPGVFTFNTIIRGFAESPNPRPALAVHHRMLESPVRADTHTYPFLLKACAKLLDLAAGEKVHCRSVKDGLDTLVFVQNALVHFYSACGFFEDAHKMFDGMSERNLVTWNSVINGFAINGRPNEALTLFRLMSFDDEHVEPDGFTMVSLLTACAELGALALGKRGHVYLFKKGLDTNVHVANALIDLYSKCGTIRNARNVFYEMGDSRNVVSWTSLIVGLAVNGFGEEALELFAEMERRRLPPTEITLVGVLSACSHCGLVDDGFNYFDRLQDEYNITPKIEHYGCMVDLLGRAGLVEEAYEYIMTMPVAPNAIVWRTLLGACAMHKRVALGEAAWSQLVSLDPGHSGDYVLLSNLYASASRWADVHKLRRGMLKTGVRKKPGHSLVELGNKVHEFVMGDTSHPQSDAIFAKLEEIAIKLRLEGYKPRTINVLADIEEEEKENALNYHSERLAIAFTLMNTAPGTPMRIVKNLRVCEDCHLVTKLISKIYEREIVVRDRSRFHHFRDGSCSCRDYW